MMQNFDQRELNPRGSNSARFVEGGLEVPLNPRKFSLKPHWFSQKYIDGPLCMVLYHKLSTGLKNLKNEVAK